MKKYLESLFGKSWKTTVIGYAMALLVAVQPLLTETVDFTNKGEATRYFLRLIFAGLIALMGKWAADSSQVKKVDAKVSEHIEETK